LTTFEKKEQVSTGFNHEKSKNEIHERFQLEQLSVEIELPGDSLSQQRLSTSLQVKPMEAMLDGVEYRLLSDEGISNPVLLTFATAPIVKEAEPNDNPSKAQKVSVPCEYVGQFYPRGDRDWLSFEAKKG
jgi:hypothetical protein